MLNKSLLLTEVQEFIQSYSEDLSKLAFSGSPFVDISTQELMQQIESRRKIEKKLPTWFSKQGVFYPPKLNLEQTSSEITAQYKASLLTGKTIADITGGFGIDSFYFSQTFKTVHHFEINQELSEIAQHNFKALDKTNIQCFAQDGLKAVLNNKYDVIYADPSRRHDSKGKVFFLNDCVPNIPENILSLLENCNTLLLKTSPMLDISIGLQELKQVHEIHIIAVENDVKELLWLVKKGVSGNPIVKTINFTKSTAENFEFIWGTNATASYQQPQKYLYEPNAAIMKSGAFEKISENFKLNKLEKHTHLYTSNELSPFPGRRFLIEKVVPYSKAEIRAALTFNKANIAIRNFPESVAVLRKKWKIKDGGDKYLYFVTSSTGKKVVLFCSKT